MSNIGPDVFPVLFKIVESFVFVAPKNREELVLEVRLMVRIVFDGKHHILPRPGDESSAERNTMASWSSEADKLPLCIRSDSSHILPLIQYGPRRRYADDNARRWPPHEILSRLIYLPPLF
jgi:hypothetical protein